MSVFKKSIFSLQSRYGLTLPMFIVDNNFDNGLALSPKQLMSILEKSDVSYVDYSGLTLANYVIFRNKDQNLNLSSEQIMSIFERCDLELFNNNFVEAFFFRLGSQFELSEKHIYKMAELFNTNIEEMSPENQEKIKQILSNKVVNGLSVFRPGK